MASAALDELEIRLADVDELITAHGTLTGHRRGRPIESQGGALTRGGVLLLYAATELFVENLFEEAAAILFARMTPGQRETLINSTSRRLNSASPFNIEMLYFNLGMRWVLSDIRWNKFSNAKFRKALNNLVAKRHELAHGRWSSAVRLQSLRAWLAMVRRFAPRLEQRVSDELLAATGMRPPW
jgi:hypothetical protein